MNLIQTINEILKEKNWDAEQKFKLTRFRDVHLISAKISPNKDKDWLMRINLDPEFEEKSKEFQKKIYEKTIEDSVAEENNEAIIYESITHEKGHSNKLGQSLSHLTDEDIDFFNPTGCPGTIEYVAMLTSAVAKGLKKAKDASGEFYFPVVDYDLAFETANIFSDIIVNTCAAIGDKKRDKFKEGRFFFYAKEGLIDGTGYTDLYTIFVDIQMNLYMNKPRHRNCAKKYTKKGFYKLREVAKKAIGILTNPDLADKVIRGLPSKTDLVSIYKSASDIDSWMKKAEDFAELIAPYIKQPIQIDLSWLFKKAKEDLIFRRAVIAKCLEKGYDTTFADNFELIDEFLEKRAGEIVTKYFDFQRNDSRTPIAYLKNRRYEAHELVVSGVTNWQKTKLLKVGSRKKIELYKKELPLEVEDPEVCSMSKLKDFGTIADSSGSMHYNILEWVKEGKNLSQMTESDFGKYDLWLLGKWACLNYLERIRKADTIKYNSVVFSSEDTLTSGWKSYWDIDEVKRNDIFGYTCGTTNMNIDALEKYIKSARNNCFTIFGTDGAFDNTCIRDNVLEKMRLHAIHTSCVLFNIGDDTDSTFSEEFKTFGDVRDVHSQKDYVGMVLEEAHKQYGGGK